MKNQVLKKKAQLRNCVMKVLSSLSAASKAIYQTRHKFYKVSLLYGATYDTLQGSKIFAFHRGSGNFFFKNLLFLLFLGHLGSERPQEEKMNAKSMFFQKLEKVQCSIVVI